MTRFALTIYIHICALAITASASEPLPTHDIHAHRVATLLADVPAHLRHRANNLHVPPATLRPVSSNRFSIRPADFGADPTGLHDSIDAIQKAVQHCVNRSKTSPNGVFPGLEDDWGPVRDAGGCLIDLDGGEYRISQTIVVPEMVANMQLGHGSIVADAQTFPHGGFLIVVGVPGSCNFPQGSCNMDINFPNLFLDGSSVANGIQVNNVMGTTIGPGGYFLNFTSHGLQINKGHEVMMDRCWLGETNFDYKFAFHGKRPSATAIEINGNDHYILNTIVFSSKIGIQVNGSADVVTGVHVWFPLNQALSFNDTIAFHIPKGGNRFTGCYADGGRIVFEGQGLQRNFWTGGFECCAADNVTHVPHGVILRGNTIGPGLEIFNNIFQEFQGGNVWHEPSPRETVPTVLDSRITDNAGVRSTRASQSLKQVHATAWRFDFCQQLVFPVIASVRVSLQVEHGFPQYIARPARNCTVLVETNIAVSGTMTVEVDSSGYTSKPEQNALLV